MDFSKIFMWLASKVSVTKIMFLALIICSVIILSPDSYIQKIKMTEFLKDNGWVAGILFLVSIGYFVYNGIVLTYIFFKNLWNQRQFKKRLVNYLSQLDDKEKSVLREFIIFKKKSTLSLPIIEPTIAGLLSKKIIMQIGEFAEDTRIGLMVPCCITPLALTQINNDILGITDEGSQSDLTQDRPLFEQNLFWRDNIKVVPLKHTGK